MAYILGLISPIHSGLQRTFGSHLIKTGMEQILRFRFLVWVAVITNTAPWDTWSKGNSFVKGVPGIESCFLNLSGHVLSSAWSGSRHAVRWHSGRSLESFRFSKLCNCSVREKYFLHLKCRSKGNMPHCMLENESDWLSPQSKKHFCLWN